MGATVAEQTAADRMAALALANGARSARRALRERVSGFGWRGRAQAARELADAVQSSHTAFGSVFVGTVIQWVPQVGDVRTRAIMRAAGIDPWARMRRLTDRQRTALVVVLRRYADGLPLSNAEPAPPLPTRSLVCSECGEQMMRRSVSGMCGFCETAPIGGRS